MRPAAALVLAVALAACGVKALPRPPVKGPPPTSTPTQAPAPKQP